MNRFFRNIAVNYIRAKFKVLSAVSRKKAAKEAFDLFCTPPTRNDVTLPAIFSTGEHVSYSFRGLTINGYRWNGGAAKKVLIVHGFESSIVNFHQYISQFSQHGLEVLAFDAPAHGLSTGNRINADVFRAFLADVYDRFGPIERFVAHSLGGLALMLALAEIPHESDCRVALIAPATRSTTAINQFFKIIEINDPETRKEFDRLVIEIGGHPAEWFSITRALESIKADILWIHDEGDRTTPLADAKEIMNQNRSDIRFVITNGLGHSRIYRDSGTIELVSKFLQG